MSKPFGDISFEELISEYGMSEEQAQRLMQELPKLCEQLAAPQQGAQGAQAGGFPIAPGQQPMYPYPGVPGQDQAGFYYQIPQDQLYALMLQQQIAQAQMMPQLPGIDEATMDIFEKMTDSQVEDALKFVDGYILAKDQYPSPAQAGMRPGAAVGVRWPTDDLAKALASLILFGSTGMAQANVTERKDAEIPIQQRNESFWGRVFQKRDAMDKAFSADASSADLQLPPPFFYEDELQIEVDKAGIVIEDGVLRAPIAAAAAMVQEYTIDGKTIKVLKEPTELKAAADCARMLPVTNDHPSQRIVTDQKEIKGWTDLVNYDEKAEKIRTNIEVRDAETIKDIQEGKDNVSIGFMCDLDYTPGTWKDEKYDAVQRNIVLNHVAIVKKGRCPTGMCGIGHDSKGAAIISDSAITEEALIADAVTKGCPGGDGCKCGLHKGLDAKKIADICKTKKNEKKKEIKKSDSENEKTGDAKMKYLLKDAEGHTHTAELTDGNGESSTEMEHKHKIEGMVCMEAGDPVHIHVLEEVKMDEEATTETATEEAEPAADEGAPIHEALLKEKTAAITSIASEIAKNGATMKPEELREKIDSIQGISWKITESISVIRAKDIKVDEALIDAAMKVMGDTKGIETALDDIRARHEVLLDEVMDFNPPNGREYFEGKDNRELEEILKLLDSQSMIKLPANDSSSVNSKHSESGSRGKNLTDAIDRKVKEALGK